MNEKYICAMCGKVVNEDNIEVLVVGSGQLKICKDCYDSYDDETPIECNFNECTNCGEFVLYSDNECNYCGCKYKKDFTDTADYFIKGHLDNAGMILYNEYSHEYNAMEVSDCCMFYEDIDYILGYLKETYEKRKGIYKLTWLGEAVGIAVGYDNSKEFYKYLKEEYKDLTDSIKEDLKVEKIR